MHLSTAVTRRRPFPVCRSRVGWVTAQKEVKNSVPGYGCIAAGGRNQGFRATGQRFAGRRFDLEKDSNGPADQ
jgi:hypothetical protein